MGDRCSISIRFRKGDTKAFEDAFGTLEENNTELGDGTTSVWIHEVNYGGQSELEALAKDGIPFIGTNDAGDDYPPGRWCSVDGKLYEVEADMDGEPVIKTKGGKVDKVSQKAIKEYMKFEKLAEKALLVSIAGGGPYEIVIKVTLQVDPDDVCKTFPLKELQATAKEAIDEALNHASNRGFNHPLAHEVSIGVQSVEIMEESQ